jgi:hypothetical protein
MKDMKHFRRKAKRWLIKHMLIDNFNPGEWEKEAIIDLANIMYKIYNETPK